MRLTEIFDNHLNETLNSPLAYSKVSPNSYKIELSPTDAILINLYHKNIQHYECISVLFRNPNSLDDAHSLTNFFNGPKAIRVLSTIVDIFKNIKFDILVLIPDDISVDVEQKKTRLYKTVLLKMQRLGRVGRHEELHFPEFKKPVLVALHGDGEDLSFDEVAKIVKRFGIEKLGD